LENFWKKSEIHKHFKRAQNKISKKWRLKLLELEFVIYLKHKLKNRMKNVVGVSFLVSLSKCSKLAVLTTWGHKFKKTGSRVLPYLYI
jgi:hypothetical protein